jgi:hypothetical protein
MSLMKFQVKIYERGGQTKWTPRYVMANTSEEALWLVEEWLFMEGFDLVKFETEARVCKK